MLPENSLKTVHKISQEFAILAFAQKAFPATNPYIRAIEMIVIRMLRGKCFYKYLILLGDYMYLVMGF